MKLSKQDLIEISKQNPVGEDWPYFGGSPKDIESHLRATTKKINKIPKIHVEAELNHYGSGYASYAHLFCSKADGSLSYQKDGRDWVDGLTVYLSRLFPIAVIGSETRTSFDRGSSYSFLDVNGIGVVDELNWKFEFDAVKNILQEDGFELGDQKVLSDAVSSIADGGLPNLDLTKTLFDFLFYWDD